jgi:hypothetical protein
MMNSKKVFLQSMLISVLMSGCFSDPFLTERLKNLPAIKGEVESLPSVERYSDEQHRLLQSYFGTIEALDLTLRQNPDDLELLNEELEKESIQEFCSSFLVQKIRYLELRKPCQRNKFFVCAESMNQYPALVKRIRDSLNPRNRARFDGSSVCSGAL